MPEIKPYWQDRESGIVIYHGDARDILSELAYLKHAPYNMTTDPTWPNAKADLFGKDDPEKMFAEILKAAPCLPGRLAVHLGCDSDPRFLCSVPNELPFFRTSHLEIARVGYKGRLLMTGDTAYLFGKPPPSRHGAHVIPGRMIDPDSKGKQSRHPCPRKLGHVEWLLRWWAVPGELIVDPCAGSGTTGIAAKKRGHPCILIDVVEAFCEESAGRIMATPRDLFAEALPSPMQLDVFPNHV